MESHITKASLNKILHEKNHLIFESVEDLNGKDGILGNCVKKN